MPEVRKSRPHETLDEHSPVDDEVMELVETAVIHRVNAFPEDGAEAG